MTLRTRIAVIAASAVAVAVILVSLGAFLAARNELRAQVDASLLERIRLVEAAADEVRPTLRRPLPLRPFPGRGATFDILYFQAILADGTVLAPPNQSLSLPIDSEDLQLARGRAHSPLLRDVRVDGVHLRLVTAPIGSQGAVQLARPLTEVDATLSGLAVILLSVGVVGTVLGGVLGLVVARSALKPIDQLSAAAARVADTQDLDSRIEIDRQDEVGRLAASFNAMLAALEESRAEQRRLVRDAGHELRTPLTSVRTNIELLARTEEMPAAERRDLLESVTSEIAELSLLVAEVVGLATDAYGDEPVAEVRLDEVVADSVARALRRSGRNVELHAEPSLVMGRRRALERAVGNLIDNAEKWSPGDSPIEVTVVAGRAEVRDHGPGIADRDKSHVFERFYRAPAARATPGSGLGLSIVKQVIDDHEGTVFVEDADGGGAVVGFQLAVVTSEGPGSQPVLKES